MVGFGTGLRVLKRHRVRAGSTVPLAPFVTAIWGQSGPQHILNQFDDVLPKEPLVAQDRVTFWWHDRTNDGASGVQSVTLNDITRTTPVVTAAMVAMANTFMRRLPGRDVRIVMHTQSGTSPREIMDDAFVASNPDGEPPRRWQDDWALDAAATADGHRVAHPYQFWFAAPGSWADDYGQNMFAFLTGRDHETGARLSYSEAAPLDVNGIAVSRTLAELYTHAPRWIAGSGANTFYPNEDLLNAVTRADGAAQMSLTNKQRSTESWRAVIGTPALAEYFGPESLSVHGYAVGYDNGSGDWLDIAHPTGALESGINRMARLIAHTILRGAGVTTYPLPRFDNAAWQPDGAFVDIWSSAGPVTTPRGGTGPGNTHPHWTHVLGFEIDGAPAQRAEIQPDGRVRVYPNVGSFTNATLLSFGRGGASGWITHNDDAAAGLWDDYPVVDMGLGDVPGVPVLPLPDPGALASTIVGVASFQTSNTGPVFKDPLVVGAGRTVATMLATVVMDADQADGAVVLVGATGNTYTLQALRAAQAIRITARAAGGSNQTRTSADNQFTVGAQMTVVACVDIVAGTARAWVDGVEVLNVSDLVAGPEFQSGRNATMLGTNPGTSQFKGRVERLALWYAPTTDGSEPAVAPYKEIVGSAATANADGWKLGADAT